MSSTEVKTLSDASESPAVRAAQGQLDAYNARDIDAFVSWYTEDCEARDFATGALLIGAGAIFRERYAELFKSHPQQRADLLGRTVQGRFVIDVEYVHGFADGRAPRQAVAIYEVNQAGKIARIWFMRDA